MDPLRAPVASVRGVGQVLAGRLNAAGCRRVGDLLMHLPRRYEDRRDAVRLSDLLAASATAPGADAADAGDQVPGAVTVIAQLVRPRRIFGRRRFSRIEAAARDGDAEVAVVWFNQPYLANQVEDGREYILHGPLRPRAQGGPLQLVNPSVERFDADAPVRGGVKPVYGRIGEVPARQVRRLLAAALEHLHRASGPGRVEEWIPQRLLDEHGLPGLTEALTELHRPGDEASADELNERTSPAHARLAYGEFLLQQLQLAIARQERQRETRPHRYRLDDRLLDEARGVLPFRLTGAQERVLTEIRSDLERPEPMLRLVQGDVGSGKTVLAALAGFVAARSGLQSALMAPTELLAEQHFGALVRILGTRIRIALVTSGQRVAGGGGQATRGVAVDKALASGGIDLAVGTHALIAERTRFARLGLAVIDEQHRFGVVQRQSLAAKGVRPDLLVMTATPIPRSLALTVYGDLDVSLVDELPPGRQPIETRVLEAGGAEEAAVEVRRRLAAGGRAFIVLPLIDGGEATSAGLPTLEQDGAGWAKALGASWGMVHGRMNRQERERTMQRFASGAIQVLLATTVIEVGVDVPEATAMVILGAERFGLAQLHQLRGRIGRGSDPTLGDPLCIALAGNPTDEARRRLATFAASTDGFRIAEEDLRQRGPGEVLGTRQSGLPQFRFGDPTRHWTWLVAARRDAAALVERMADPESDWAAITALRRRLQRRRPARTTDHGGGSEGTQAALAYD